MFSIITIQLHAFFTIFLFPFLRINSKDGDVTSVTPSFIKNPCFNKTQSPKVSKSNSPNPSSQTLSIYCAFFFFLTNFTNRPHLNVESFSGGDFRIIILQISGVTAYKMSVPPPAPHLFPPSFINNNESVTWPDNRPYHDRAIPGPGPEFPPLKRPRTNPSDSFSNQVPNPIMPPPIPPPVYRGTSKIFFKTRICAKFKEGTCPLGNNCNFAHGVEELRQPPPNWKQIVTSYGDDQAGNWDDNQRIISKLKLCRSFCNGEVCPYGERCNFLHEDPSKFREDPGRFEDRENLVISGTTSLLNNGNGSHQPDGNMVMNSGFDANPMNQNPFILKTRICNQWERTGRCAYGDKCRYAHGRAELHNFGGHNEDGIVVNAGPAPSKPLYTHVDYLLPSDTAEMASTPQNLTETPLFKLKKLSKINRIYGDWIDDLSVRSSANT